MKLATDEVRRAAVDRSILHFGFWHGGYLQV